MGETLQSPCLAPLPSYPLPVTPPPPSSPWPSPLGLVPSQVGGKKRSSSPAAPVTGASRMGHWGARPGVQPHPVLPLGPGDAPAPPCWVLHMAGPPLLCHPPTTALTLSQWFLSSCLQGDGASDCEWSGRVTALSSHHPLRPQTHQLILTGDNELPLPGPPGAGLDQGQGLPEPPTPRV